MFLKHDEKFTNLCYFFKVLSLHLDGLVNVKEEVKLLSSMLIKSPNTNINDEDRTDFLSLYLKKNSSSVEDCLQLFRLLIQWYKIDIIKPLMLSYISKNFKNVKRSQHLLEFLVELVYNVDPKAKLVCIFDMQSVEDNSLDFTDAKSFHKTIIKDLSKEMWKENPLLFWFSVVVLFHMRLELYHLII